jgi:hypothetical protein
MPTQHSTTRTSLIVLAAMVLCACGSSAGGSDAGSNAGGSTGSAGAVGGATGAGGGAAGAGGGAAGAGGGAAGAGGGAAGAGGGAAGAAGAAGAGGTTDAGMYNFACSGRPLPTAAPATITLTGRAMAAGNPSTPLSGASVNVVGPAGATLGSATSGADGTFSINLTTGGVPLDAHVRVTATGRTESNWFPAAALSADARAGDINLFDSTTITLLAGVAGITPNAMRSQVFVTLGDCDGAPLPGATVSVNPAPAVTRYISGGVPNAQAMSTTQSGTVFLGNLPSGNVTIDGQRMGVMLRSRVVASRGAIVLQVALRP